MYCTQFTLSLKEKKQQCTVRLGATKAGNSPTYLQGLLEKIASGMYFSSSSVMYFGKGHLGRTVEGPAKTR